MLDSWTREKNSAAESESAFRKEVEQLINRNSLENGSQTPDFILAEYLTDCLKAFDKAVCQRTYWHRPKG